MQQQAQKNEWDTWAQHALISGANKAADHVGIYGHDGRCWGGSDDVAKSLPQSFFGEAEKLMAGNHGSGKLVINGTGYITVNRDDDFVTAKTKTEGVSVCKSKQTYIVSIFDGEDVHLRNNFCAASKVCDMLKDSGY